MNQRFMDLEALEIYAKNLITYSNYLIRHYFKLF